MSNTKSYVCPVCGRALSSPGSLGRHLLIHSEDRLSNCAVCGARFTDTNNFNRSASALLQLQVSQEEAERRVQMHYYATKFDFKLKTYNQYVSS